MTKTDREIESLVRTYYKARERLLKIITNPSTGVGTKTYYTEILRGLQRELGGLKEKTDGFVQTVIPSEYRASLKDTVQHFKRHNLRMDAPANFASIHTDALYTIILS